MNTQKSIKESAMRKLATVLVLTALLSAGQVNADALGPNPQIIAQYDRDFIERSGAQTYGEMLDTGILRYFFTGGRNLLVMINGRPYGTTASNLDTIPLSAVERIEVLRPESLGTVGGHAAVRGAFNLVLREDLEGIEVRAVTRMPSEDGGDARQGSMVWGGATGSGGHLTIGLDILSRDHIPGGAREHSRSEWEEDGSFADAKNVSIGGNTLYVYDTGDENNPRRLRSFSLGTCKEMDGYTGPLSNPSGIRSGDKGCGYAYGDIWWDTEDYEQENIIMNLSQPLEDDVEFLMDANFTSGQSKFRYAPSVGTFTINQPPEAVLDEIDTELMQSVDDLKTDAAKTYPDRQYYYSVAHRFIGHGNRDWITDYDESDISATVKGKINDNLGFEAQISNTREDGLVVGNTFVSTEEITKEIRLGRYDLTNPRSDDPQHKEAIKRSSVREFIDFGWQDTRLHLALNGNGPSIGERSGAWTAGVEFADVKSHTKYSFQPVDGTRRSPEITIDDLLGTGGYGYDGERDTAGAFAEVTLPLTAAMEVRAAGRVDKYDDVGTLRSWRLGAEYFANDIVTFRGSWSTGDNAPSMSFSYAEDRQDHPYVRCVPNLNDPKPKNAPRDCDQTHWVQVTRNTTGDPELKPSDSERISLGIEARKGPYYFVADWYQLKTLDLPGQYEPSWAILNHKDCSGTPPVAPCIENSGDGSGLPIIHDVFVNNIDTEVKGLNTRFGTRTETDWGFISMRGFWRYVDSSDEPLPRHAVRIVPSVGRGNLTAYWALNYRSEIDASYGGEFSSWTGHDLTFDWKNAFGYENMRFTAGVYNVTDTKLSTNPANPTQHDGPTAAGWGRTFFATLNLRF